MGIRKWWAAACLGVLLGNGAWADAPKVDDYPRPERYGDLNQYVADANQWLRDHPADASSPRVVLDTLMVANAAGVEPMVQRCKTVLLFFYPASRETRLVLQTFADGKSCGQFIGAALEQDFESRNPELALRLSGALRAATDWFHADVLYDDAFILQCVVACSAAGDKSAVAQLLTSFDQRHPAADDLRTVRKLLLADGPFTVVQLHQLHQLADRGAVAPFELFAAHSVKAAPSAELTALLIEDLITLKNFDGALQLLKAAPADWANARLLFYRGWSEAALGHGDDAEKTFAQAVKDFPGDPWTPCCEQLSPAARGLDSNLAANEKVLSTLIERARAGLGQIEIRGNFKVGTDRFSAYLSLVPPGMMNFVVQKNGQVFLAYRTDRKECASYMASEGVIHEFGEPGPLLYPQVRIAQDAFGKLNFSFNAGMAQSQEQFDEAVKSLADLPALATTENRKQFLRQWVSRGDLPQSVVEDSGVTTLNWTRPSAREPKFEHYSIAAKSDGSALALGNDQGTISVRWGSKGAFPLDPTPWPTARTDHQDKLKAGWIMQLLPAIAEMVPRPAATTQPATR